MMPRLGVGESESLGCPPASSSIPPSPGQPSKRRHFRQEMLLHVRWAWSESGFERE